ncbi:TonB-dependent receptor [Sediminibacterium soli]|uniref:TonB-dependent receptor n=1 Tax=Sediminibacterium soli TaxID=2698829 RepID=UPI00137A7703|nr:TonB-dependent receptor [Sediminibacterium soli]NCI45442.1 TonB-dependent receptor [Sediminibacterium soli]
MKSLIGSRRLFLFTLFASLAGGVFALPPTEANSFLSGKVFDDKTGHPLAGAVVYIHEAKTGTVTDSAGHYKTPSVPVGRYLVEVSFEGYTSILETIEITGNRTREFRLKQTYAESDAVTVTGIASAIKTKQSAQPVSILKRSDLMQTSSTNIIDAVAKAVPGVSSLSTGPAISKPVIRGLGYNRVVTVHDGVRQEGQQWGDEHGIEVDEYSVQKVEVLKGPASLLYGSDAMAGVIHLITNVPVEQGTVKGNLMGSFIGNNNLYGSNANIAGHLQNGFNWNVYGTAKSAGDYRNKYDGKVFNSRFNEKNIGGYFGWNKSWGYSHVLISRFDQTIGVVEGTRDPATGGFIVFGETPYEHTATSDDLNSRNVFTPKQHITHFKIASDNNISLGADRLAFNIGFQRNQRREMGDPEHPNTPGLFFDLQTLTYSLQYQFGDRHGWKTSTGISGMYQQNRNLAGEVLIPEYNQFDIGAFVYTKKTFHDNLTLSGGIRADQRSLNSMFYTEGGVARFASFRKTFGNISGSLGLSYNASDAVTLKLNLSRGYRAPSVSELASNGAHEGTNRYEYGDNNLKTETSMQADAGVEINTPHISFALNGFYNHISNYIFYSKLESATGGDSMVNVGGTDITAFTFRQAAASLAGFEMKLDLHPHPLDWLHFENTFSLVAGQFSRRFEGSNRLPFMPAPRLQSELRGNFNKAGKGVKNLYAKIEMDIIGTQNRIFTAYHTETPTAGYTLFHAGIGADITNRSGRTVFGINLALNNFTDAAYQDHLSRLKYTDVNAVTGRRGVFNMGRSFSVKLNVPLEWRVKNN